MLEIVGYAGSDGRKSLWDVRCDCGNIVVMDFSSLSKGTKSCGCSTKKLVSQANVRHGLSKHPAYAVWRSMKARCTNPNHKAYKNYGGRGISVCSRWLESVENFWADMGSSYRRGLELDRVDNNGNYEPANCRWATVRLNTCNKRNNKYIKTPLGEMLLCEASKISGIGHTTLSYRASKNVPAAEIFNPPNKKKSLAGKSKSTTSSNLDPGIGLL